MSDNRKNLINHYSVKPLHVALHPSRLLAGALILGCTTVAVMTALLPLPVWGRAALIVLLLAGLVHAIQLYVRMGLPLSVTALEVSLHGQLRCQTQQHGWVDAELLGSSFVTPWLTVLNVRLPGLRFMRSVLLLPDAIDRDSFRALRVWLTWGSEAVSIDG